MNGGEVECRVVSRSVDGASVELLIAIGEIEYVLTVGLDEIVTSDEAEKMGAMLVRGELPMADEDWCKKVMGAKFGKVLPFLTPQRSED